MNDSTLNIGPDAPQPAAEPAAPVGAAKPKRLATSGTRKGNGAGWGGAAKGAGSGGQRAPAFVPENKAGARQKTT